MIAQALEPGRWPATRWWTLIGLVLAGQLFLIFWLGKSHPAVAPVNAPAPILELANSGAAQVLAQSAPSLLAALQREGFSGSPHSAQSRLLALMDPTLFALPHQEGFSGPAWLNATSPDFEPLVWVRAPSWLELDRGWAGSELRQFMETNQFDPLRTLEQQELALKMPAHEQAELPPAQSRLRLAGGLSTRRLLEVPELPSWPGSEMLTNSIVQLVVSANGFPVSATLLKSRSAPNAADDYALRQARKLRFQPLSLTATTDDPAAGLTWGQVICEWHTVPVTLTNSAAKTTAPQ